MIIDQLFEDDKKKKLNEVDPRNFDSDEDYYAAVRGKRSSSDDDYDYEPEDDIDDMDDDESYYEKYVRTKNLEGYETTPFGSVNDQRPQMPAVPQQDREAQEQARERQARISDFREKKRDLLQQFAQLGTLRTEMIHGLDNDVFLNKDQLIDFFEQQIDDPSLTALEYAYENNIPTDGLIRNILRRATQLGVSMLDVRKMFNQAKQKLGENIGRKVDAKGLTQGEWMQAVKQKFPDAKIVQAKMIDGPAHALLSDGRKIVWNPVQGVAEGYDTAEDYRAKAEWLRRELHLSPDEAWERAYDTDPDSWVGTPWEHDYKQGVAEVGQNFRRGNARRAALNAMSPEELKAHEEKRAEQQRKRDETRLERERQRNAAKKGVAEGLNEMDKSQKGAPGWNISDDEPGGKESYGKAAKAKYVVKKAGKALDKAFDKTHSKKKIKESQLNEAILLEDPVYRKFKTVGRYIVERKMTEKEILDVFAAAEKGMTNKDTGANRTMLGRGKDATTKFAGNVSDAVKGVLNSMRTSVPVEAVEVAYNEATNALANIAGGQKGAVMQAIKKYRMLSKQYPKTAALARSALIMIAGMASSGVAPLAIIGAVGTLDRALKGNTLFNSLVGGAGDTALAGASQAVAGAFAPDATLTQPGNAGAHDMDMMSNQGDAVTPQPGDPDFQLPADSVAANEQVQLDAAREWINADAATRAEIEQITGMSPAQLQDIAVSNDLVSNADSLAPGEEIVPPGAEGFGGGTYTTVAGDEGGRIAQAMGIPFKELEGLNPQITNWNKLPIGTELQLPPTGDNVGSVWRDLSAAPGAPTTTAPTTAAPSVPAATPTAAPASPYGAVRGPMGLDYTSIAGIPVVPGQPLNPTQMAVADFAMQQGNKLSPAVQAAYDLAKRGAVRESVKFKKLSVDKLIDQKTTVLSWALSESVGRKSQSVNLTTVGTYTVFENVDRYRRALLEYTETQPGRPQLPDYYRPDMPDAPVTPDENPGVVGRGLNWLDKAAGKVGGALSNFGRQFTTNVTKEKLKMNWHQAGKPTDSDQLAAWLVKQGVPQDVVSSVYSGMGIPYTASAIPAPAAEPAAATGGAQKQMAFYGTNPATGKPWTVDELQAKARAGKTAPASTPDTADADAAATQTTTAATFPGEDPKGPGYVGRREVARRQAARAATAKPAAPNFAQQGGYAQVNQPTSVKYTGMPATKPTAPTTATLPTGGGAGVKAAAPAGTKVVSGGPTPDEQAKLAQRIAQAAKQPVAEMLQMVETKEDVARIKQFVDQTFVKYGAVSESAFAVRNRLIEHVTQVGAQRRREFARKS